MDEFSGGEAEEGASSKAKKAGADQELDVGDDGAVIKAAPASEDEASTTKTEKDDGKKEHILGTTS